MTQLTRADLWAKGPYWTTSAAIVNLKDIFYNFEGQAFRLFSVHEEMAQFVCDALNAAWEALPETTEEGDSK